MEYVIETRGLCKRFPGKLALDHVDIHVEKGDIYGLIGRNGAGKTTSMKIMLGMLKPSEGEVYLFDDSNLTKQRKRIGSLIEAPGLYKNATAYENLKRFSYISGGKEIDIPALIDFVGLSEAKDRKVSAYSLGMKQRLGLAIALLGDPEVLILDEPINGLDPAGIKEIRDLIIKLNKEKNVTFIISSHLLDELGKIATRYGIINNGVLVNEISAEELNEKCQKALRIVTNDNKKAIAILKKEKYLDQYEEKNGALYLYSHLDKTAKINETLVKEGVEVSELLHINASIEDYFIERLGK